MAGMSSRMRNVDGAFSFACTYPASAGSVAFTAANSAVASAARMGCMYPYICSATYIQPMPAQNKPMPKLDPSHAACAGRSARLHSQNSTASARMGRGNIPNGA